MTPAEAAIRDAIARDGRITFRRFMEMALYSAPGAYYGSEAEKIGAAGDYLTSPELHPSFGALVARQLEQLWIAMGRPPKFTLVEMGAGRGSLARDILSYAAAQAPAFHQTLAYLIVERSPALIRRQQETLERLGPVAGRLSWLQGASLDLPDGSVEGCFLSNELPDSFPVHRVATVGGELREIYVEVQDGRLAESMDEPSDPRLVDYFSRLGFLPPEGCRAEVNLDALDWVARVARALARGGVLTFDYGYPAEELYSQRHCDGTLLCFYRHTLNSDPYTRIGRQDITTHVDFTSIAEAGARHGLRPFDLTTQRSFLTALGIQDYLKTLDAMGLTRRGYQANWVAMQELLNLDGLGRVKLLVQQKGLEGFAPAALRPEGLRAGELGRDLHEEPVPLLTPAHVPLTALSPAEPMVDVEGMWEDLMGEGED